jgi:hypothetical protein
MPTLPMMTPTPHADASRRITAPGGYESWRFDASSDDGKLHLVAALHFGHALDPQYLRRYALYRRFPTRVRPPTPAEFCAVTFALLERGRPALRFAVPAAATLDDFHASDDGRSVRLGASHMNRAGDGILRLHLRGTYHDRTITVNLAFRPQMDASCEIDLGPPRQDAPRDDVSRQDVPRQDERDDVPRGASVGGDASHSATASGDGERGAAAGDAAEHDTTSSRSSNSASPSSSTSTSLPASSSGRHGWVVVDPLCDVDGEISLFVAESGGPPRVTAFAGVGCHDHRFGTRPLGELADRWLAGRALFDDRAILFQQVGDDAAFVCRARVKDSAPPRISTGGVKLVGSGTSRWAIGYPETVELPGDVRLLRPRVVGSSLASVIIAYDAVGDLETGRALVQVLKPRRLRWAPR